ncbi:MAG: lamin tail domain-containing protein [Akkermansiaceae bacterium]|nr:lamin tail domain-containing protein [Akkermansiaceae bacterium]
MNFKSTLIPVLLLVGSRSLAQTNIAIGRPVSASGQTWSGQVAANLTDGNEANQSHPLASSGTLGFYYEIDLGSTTNLGSIELVNRSGCCPERLSNYRVEIRVDNGGSAGAVTWSADIRTDGSDSGQGGRDLVSASLDSANSMSGRYVRVVNLSNAAYNPQIAEIEAFEAPLPNINFFTVDQGNITATGDPNLPTSAELSWTVSNVDTITIDQGIGAVALTGQQTIMPAITATYVLTATNSSGTISKSVTVGVDEPVIPPALTEFMAANASTLDDQFGNSSDWIEIQNRNSFDLSLEGYHLTDKADNLTQWTFPAGSSISANGFLVVFASGENLINPTEALHTNFSLKKSGEYLALVDRDGSTILTDFNYPEEKQDISYGLEIDGTTAGFFSPATPGRTNTTSFAGFTDDTKFDIPRGFYETAQAITITSNTPAATIRYTTNGSEPSVSNGTTYSGPVSVTTTTVLRAMAFKTGLAPTNVDTNTYLFVDDVIASPELNTSVTPQMQASLTEVPTLSIVTSQAINGTSEVPASFELINPDGTPGFQEDCGVKNFGGAFTDFAKKNFRMYFRSRYGASKLKHPLFEGFDRGISATDTFDQLNIRSGSHDMERRGFYMSNRFTDDTMLDMGNINPHGRFMHLYLNGKYWGVFHLRERWSADLITSYLGGPKDAHEAINGNWNVGGWADSVAPPYDGDGSAWERIKIFALSSTPQNFDDLMPYLDTQHFIDYMIMFMFGDSEAEYRTAGPADIGSGFKWFLNDADGYLRTAGNRTGFASNTPGVFGRSAGDGPGSIFSLLFKAGNPEFRTLLADRIHRHYFNEGAMTPSKTISRLEERCDEMDAPFYAEALRWNYRSHNSWTSAKNNAISRILPGRSNSALSQFRSAGFYPATIAPVFSQHGGDVFSGFNLTMAAGSGTMYYTIDGSDPRLEGGGINPGALPFQGGQNTTTIIPQKSDWKYLDDGSDQGTTWQDTAFDDSSWASGPAILGYGEPVIATTVSFGPTGSTKHRTTYFRKSITLANTAEILSGSIEIKRDDGAVVYLNGTEVGRTSMRTGAIDYQTLANTAADDGDGFHTLGIPTNLFLDGNNTIAVEIHQSSDGSSDLQFDLELKITRPAAGASTLSMTENTFVRSRSLNGNNWSALNEAFFNVTSSAPVEPAEVFPAEIHYNPTGPDDSEFIELHNRSGHAINLRACFFSAGIDFTFPDNRDIPLAPNARVLLVDSQFGIDEAYGPGLPVIGVYRDNLNNGGENLTLMTPDGITALFSVTYDGADPWPQEADGTGRSLVLSDPTDLNNPASWRPSLTVGGTPGTDDSVPFSGDPDADLDGDQFTAFTEYVLGTDDSIAGDAIGLTTFLINETGHWEFIFPQALTATDVTATVQISTNLTSWDPITITEAVFTHSTLSAGRILRTFTSVNPATADRLFVRLSLQKVVN